MARYLLLEFDDNAEAEAFAKSLEQTNLFFSTDNGDGTGSYGYADPQKVRIKALFAKPTQFCDCPPDDRSVRSKNYSWMVHAKCKKPKRGVCQHPRNLLDPPDMKIRERLLYLGVYEGVTESPIAKK